MLTAARLKELLSYDSDTGIFTCLVSRSPARAGQPTGCLNPLGYTVIGVDRKLHYAHRLAWLYTHGSWPNGVIDHINGQRSDNRLANLRDVTQKDNVQNPSNRPKKNQHGATGVYKDRKNGRWLAAIFRDGKKYFLGAFESMKEAGAAYNEADEKLRAGITPTRIDATLRRRSDNISGFRGVYWDKQLKHWRARITANKEKFHIGLFDAPEEAHAAYCEARKRLLG